MASNEMYRLIPKVDVLLENEEVKELTANYGREVVLHSIQEKLGEIRKSISAGFSIVEIKNSIDSIVRDVAIACKKTNDLKLRRVINATGTILHTNLGRALISKEHLLEASEMAGNYSNLEYDIEVGKRGERYSHFAKLICDITGAEDAMAVNNNAGAVFLILSALAEGGEVIVSRGELVEIGGKFRIPDVMAQSGARLKEIGTTNKTHEEDYTKAINDETKLVLKVHTSNYKVMGFTASVDTEIVSSIAHEHEIPIVEDLGSGVLIDLSKYGLPHEPTVQESIANGVDVVCFSGDKLLGGPQAGIIAGKKKYIEKIKKHQLTRALRIDKLTASLLELTFREYLSLEKALKNIPTLQMISAKPEELEKRATRLIDELKNISRLQEVADIKLISLDSQVGGGSMPTEYISANGKYTGLAFQLKNINATAFSEILRGLEIPIISRIEEDKVLMDMRTVRDDEIAIIAEQLKSLDL